MDQVTRQLYQERERRYIDAVQMRVPDRVPVSLPLSYFPARFAGITFRDAYYDFPKWKDAFIKAALYLQPDRCSGFPNQPGQVLEMLDSRTMHWPGHGVSIYSPHQFVEGEYMKAEEYDLLLSNHADFNIRYLAPRSYGLLAPLAKLPPIEGVMNLIPFNMLAQEEFADMFETLQSFP